MQKLAFIGCGNMAGAILKGILKAGTIPAGEMTVFDVVPAAQDAAAKLGVKIADSEKAAAESAEITLLAVKPNGAASALKNAAPGLEGKALISIVAGLSSAQLLDMAGGGDIRILRVMPNTPALVGAGMMTLCSDNTLNADEREKAERYLGAVGVVDYVPEKLMDAVTGLSGSGPAFVSLFIEALSDGGVVAGLSRPLSYKLAAQTVMGTAKMIMESGMHPGQVKDMVSSPGGTTIAGVRMLEKGGLRSALIEAVVKAAEKSAELGKVHC